MKTSEGGNLPIVNGTFAAGDPRAAENFALTSLHALFVREHNYQVDKLHKAHPNWSGDQLYNYARAIVTAEIANITYKEFLPNLIGDDAIGAYHGYNSSVDPRLSFEFNIAFRFGHSIVSAETESLTESGEVVAGSERELRDIFFAPPSDFVASGGADGQLRHLAGDPSQAMDVRIVEDLRNFLFDPPVSMDLAAINIQRERDFGIGSLNDVRESLGLARYTDIDQITSDPGTRAALKIAFSNNVDLIDLWTGGLAENHAPGALIGETFQTVIAMQFEALRDGDRLWFENQGFDAKTLQQIKQTTLADIILRNTDTQHIQDDVFISYTRHTGLKGGVESEDPEARQLVIGSDGKDTLIGGPQGDFLFAGTGKQTLTGLSGAPTISSSTRARPRLSSPTSSPASTSSSSSMPETSTGMMSASRPRMAMPSCRSAMTASNWLAFVPMRSTNLISFSMSDRRGGFRNEPGILCDCRVRLARRGHRLRHVRAGWIAASYGFQPPLPYGRVMISSR
ncbi:hypothetical protein CQ12_14635 [Bradyrhizobium jicamae]|uniref:Peroxidase n=1 Tax=Bradyrhizobium jicamae TaxID=280332 RepID=A0A0R3LR63_9BRAD|nr:hypothetical protein CQ12_14635 [Bradyrhizobium jicamae]